MLKIFFKILIGFGYAAAIYVVTFLITASFSILSSCFNEWKSGEDFIVAAKNVEIIGNKRLSDEEILLVADLDKKVSWFDLNEEKIESYLTSCGWVKTAFVKKIFPNSLQIVVEEFVPAMAVTSRKRAKREGGRDLYTIWFADSEGVLFKRASPHEKSEDMPIFHLNYDAYVNDDSRRQKIKEAAAITELLNKEIASCKIKTIKYEAFSGYKIFSSCDGGLPATLYFGENFSNKDLKNMVKKAADSVASLLKNRQWAQEYIFDNKNGKIDMTLGSFVKNVDNRGELNAKK